MEIARKQTNDHSLNEEEENNDDKEQDIDGDEEEESDVLFNQPKSRVTADMFLKYDSPIY
jgi:hypothetical protein